MGTYLSEPKKEKKTETGSNSKYEFSSSCMQGWRTSMEDAHIAQLDIGPDTHIFGVFDGHGGKEVAVFVEKYFISQLKASEGYKKNDMSLALTQTFQKMDEMLMDPKNKQELFSYKEKDSDYGYDQNVSHAGCTANVVIIKDGILYCANAGDTRCCIGSNGVLVKMSKDHKPDDEGEKKRIQAAGGEVIEGRVDGNLNLSRALGDLEYKKNENIPHDQQLIICVPDIKTRKLEKQDEFIILGCDGIWETQTSPDIITWVRNSLKNNSVKVTSENILDWLIAPDTRTGAGCDNMSVILIKIKQ